MFLLVASTRMLSACLLACLTWGACAPSRSSSSVDSAVISTNRGPRQTAQAQALRLARAPRTDHPPTIPSDPSQQPNKYRYRVGAPAMRERNRKAECERVAVPSAGPVPSRRSEETARRFARGGRERKREMPVRVLAFSQRPRPTLILLPPSSSSPRDIVECRAVERLLPVLRRSKASSSVRDERGDYTREE